MPKRNPIDVDELKKVFRVHNGKLERIDLRRTDGKWKVVDNKTNNSDGYCQVNFNGRMVLYHVIIWILSTGKDIPQELEIDHINGNRLDSRMENMRLVTSRQNNQNKKIHRGGRLYGCNYHKCSGKYQAKIQISGKLIYLGLYKTEQEAHKAYKIACKHITDYVDSDSFREFIKKSMENNNG